MKKITLLIITTLAMQLYSCSTDTVSVEGTVSGDKHDGETVYLYMLETKDYDNLVFLATTTVEAGKFSFEGIEKIDKFEIDQMPTIGFVSMFDMLDESLMFDEGNELPVATVVLEKGEAKVEFDGTSVVLGGTARNDKFNKIHLAITEIVNFAGGLSDFSDLDNLPVNAAGRDGRAQFQDLNLKFKDLTFDFTKENITNNVGQFLFLKSYTDNMFTPAQMVELIAGSTEAFKSTDEVKELKDILDTMNEGLPMGGDSLNFGNFDEEIDLSEVE